MNEEGRRIALLYCLGSHAYDLGDSTKGYPEVATFMQQHGVETSNLGFTRDVVDSVGGPENLQESLSRSVFSRLDQGYEVYILARCYGARIVLMARAPEGISGVVLISPGMGLNREQVEDYEQLSKSEQNKLIAQQVHALDVEKFHRNLTILQGLDDHPAQINYTRWLAEEDDHINFLTVAGAGHGLYERPHFVRDTVGHVLGLQ